MDLGSDTTAGASLVHSDELRALEQSFQDQLSALQLRVTSLEYRLHPASLRAADSDSGSKPFGGGRRELGGYHFC